RQSSALIVTLSLHDALPIYREAPLGYLLLVPTLVVLGIFLLYPFFFGMWLSITDSELGNVGKFIGLGNYRFELRNTDGVFYGAVDRKSTRLNSSHVAISYAV